MNTGTSVGKFLLASLLSLVLHALDAIIGRVGRGAEAVGGSHSPVIMHGIVM